MPTTSWSLVLAAGERGADTALSRICETYWFPLYAFLRRQGYPAENCEDLTQAFFAKLIEKNYIASAASDRGRFRSFLLTSLKHFVANQQDSDRALKRGGGVSLESIDLRQAEGRLDLDASDHRTPESIYERDWALALIERVRQDLREEWNRLGQSTQFAAMQPFLTGASLVPQLQAAEALGMSEGAFKVAVHRLRKQFRQALRDEIASTVESPEEVDEELAFLLAALSS